MIIRLAVALCAIAAVCAPRVAAGAWTGREVTKNGIVHVMNPATPSEGANTVSPQELWSAGGDDEDMIFGVVRDIAVDEAGQVYLLDVQLNLVHVFDRDGVFLRDIGREGEGPGEFRRPSSMFIMPDGKIAVVQMMPGKIVLLNPDGTPAGDFRGPDAPDRGMQMYFDAGRAGKSVVLGVNHMTRSEGSFTSTRTVHLLDSMGEPRATLATATSRRDMGRLTFDEKEARGPEWAAAPDGRIFLSEDFDAYAIKRFTPAGTVDRVIEREYRHRARTKREIEENRPQVRFRRGDGRTRRPEATASPTDRDIVRMYAREDGSLWVLSSYGAFVTPTGTLVTLDVYDPDGRFVREMSLDAEGSFRSDGIEVAGDHLFVVRQLRSAERAMMADDADAPADDADAEPMSVVCYRLAPPPTARK